MGIRNRDGALYAATGIDCTGFYEGRREAIGIIKAMAGQITSFDVFSGIGISAATAFAQAAKSSYDFEKEFRKNMLEVATISTQVEGSMTDFMNQVMAITQEIPVTAPEAAKALYQIVSAGHDGAAGMKVLGVSARSAIGGMTDTATAADAITTLLNAYKLSADDAEKVSDQLFTTARLGKTTFGELGQSIAQVAPIAASYGVEMDQVLAAVATLTKSGTPTAQAMTQIRASIIGTSKVLGDGAFNTRTFQEALAEVAAMAGGSESKLRELIPEVEAVNGVLGMTGIKAQDAASHLAEMNASAGATSAAFKLMMNDVDKQMTLLSNNIQAALRPMGQAILKEVSEVVQAFNEAFENGDIENSLKNLGDLIVIVTGAIIGYKGAIVASTIVQKINMAVLRESVLIRQLEKVAIINNTVGHKALTAAQIKEMATKKLLTSAIKAQTVAMLKNTAAMLTNPYVLAAAAVAALGYGLYKYATQATIAEKAMAAHNKRVNDLKEWADQTSESVEGMLSSLRDENVLMTKKVDIYEKLKGLYLDELENISLQNFLLMDSVQANNLLAKALDERIKAQQRADVNAIEAEMKTNDSRIATLDSKSGMNTSVGEWFELRQLKSRNEQLKLEYEKAKDIVIQGLEDEAAAKEAAEALDKDNESGKTVIERKIKLTKELADAEAKLKNLRAPGSTAKQSEIDAAQTNLDAIKGKLKALTGISEKEGDKLKQTQSDLSRSILDSELKLQAGRISAMEDGKTKRIAIAEQEYQETLAVIQKEKDEYEKSVKETGGKKDPAVLSTFDNRESAAGDKKNTDLDKIDKEYAEEYKERTKALTDVFLNEEERKLAAVKDRYDKERKWADEQLKSGSMTNDQHKSYTTTIDQAQMKENYNTLLSSLNDFKQQEKNLREKWDTDIAAAVETKDAYLVARLMEGKQKALSALNSQMLQESSEWMRLFGNLDTLTVDELNKMIDSIQAQLDSGTLTLNPVDAKALMDSLSQAKDKVAEKSPFQALAKSSGEMKKSLADLKKAEDDGLTGEALDEYRNKVRSAAENVKKSISAIGDAYGQVRDVMKSASEFISMVDEGLGETVNNALSLGDAVMNIGQVVATAVIGFANGMSTMETASVILLIIKAVLVAVMAAIALFNGDKKHEKKIKDLQGQVENLERAYKALGRTIENTYSNEVYSLMDKQEENLRKQQELIRQQIKEEEAKKKTDKDKVQEWKDELVEIENQIEDSNRKQIEMWAGTDVQTAIDDFADALVDAYAQGEDGAKAMGETTKKVLANAVKEALKKQLLGKAMQDAVTQLGKDMEDGVLSPGDKKRFEDAANAAGERFTEAMKMYDDLFKGENTEATREATAKGFATMSQSSADELDGKFASQLIFLDKTLGKVTTISEQMQFIRDLQVKGWEDVRAIRDLTVKVEDNTRQLAEMSEKIADNTDRAARATESMNDSGLIIRR